MKNVHEAMLKTTNPHHITALPLSDKQLESTSSGAGAHMLLYELQIQAKDEVRFSEFFDFSLSSLLSLRRDGTIDVINLAGARLLGGADISLLVMNQEFANKN